MTSSFSPFSLLDRLARSTLRLGIACGAMLLISIRSSGAPAQLPPAIAIHGSESTALERAQMPLPPDPDRVVHFIRPRETDPRIDQYLQDHYALYLKSVPKNGKLFVFFPGTFAMPRNYQWLLAEAAARGYLVVAIEYPSANDTLHDSAVTQICARVRDVQCSYLVRQSRLRGNHAWPSIKVDPASSIENRLSKLLAHLAKLYPQEGWSALLADGAPRWDRLVLAGHSQGAGMAALLAQEHAVARVALFSGAADHSFGTLAPWLHRAGATPADRFFALVHAEEPGLTLMLAGYAALGIKGRPDRFDASTQSQPIPAGTRLFVLGLTPNAIANSTFGAAHGSVAVDRATPLDGGGRPLYRPVWDVLIGR